MPWFKVDDNFALHPKVMRAGNEAIGLWVRAGSWAMQQLTDGFVPDDIVPILGTVKAAKRLVAVGLWLPVEGGYQFHEWVARNPSRSDLEAQREATRKRQQRWRESHRDDAGKFTEGETRE